MAGLVGIAVAILVSYFKLPICGLNNISEKCMLAPVAFYVLHAQNTVDVSTLVYLNVFNRVRIMHVDNLVLYIYISQKKT